MGACSLPSSYMPCLASLAQWSISVGPIGPSWPLCQLLFRLLGVFIPGCLPLPCLAQVVVVGLAQQREGGSQNPVLICLIFGDCLSMQFLPVGVLCPSSLLLSGPCGLSLVLFRLGSISPL